MILGNKILWRDSYQRPTYIQHTKAIVSTFISSITLTKPTTEVINNGDLMLVVIFHDAISGLVFDATSDPAGWTFDGQWGDNQSDSRIGLFSKISDGTEGVTENFTPNQAGTMVGFWIHIAGTHQTAPITNGTETISASTSNVITGLTGDADDLGFYFTGFDGSDGSPMSITAGTGWNELDDDASSTGSAGVACSLGTKIYDSTAAESVTITYALTDGNVGVQIRIQKP
jgi:hypothetical protein